MTDEEYKKKLKSLDDDELKAYAILSVIGGITTFFIVALMFVVEFFIAPHLVFMNLFTTIFYGTLSAIVTMYGLRINKLFAELFVDYYDELKKRGSL